MTGRKHIEQQQYESSTGDVSERSQEPLSAKHMQRLSELAQEFHEDFTTRLQPRYASRRLLVVLAQGGALHYLNGTNGVKDLDVWTFYAAVPGQQQRFPYRYLSRKDFGPSELGRHPGDVGNYRGRAVDLIVRALPVRPDLDTPYAVNAVQEWLQAGRSSSPRMLRQKAMVVIDPWPERGHVVWPPGDRPTAR